MTQDMMRYERQIVLPEIGLEGQAKLRQARILIIGVGGLGSPAALYLAGAGVGTLGLIDPDHVDVTNLQRQILFKTTDQGRPKVDAARDTLSALNPDIRIEIFHDCFSAGNARELASRFDLLIDGTDNFPSKFLIGDIARALGLPLVHGTVNGFEGRVALFSGKEGPCFRCLYPAPPRQKILNCAEAGVLGSVVGMVGCHQATEAVKWLMGRGKGQRLLVIDAWNSETKTFELAAKNDCPFCDAPFEPGRPEYAISITSCSQIPVELSPEDLGKLPSHTLVDIREVREWNEGHLEGAVHWPLMEVLAGAHEFHPDRYYVLYCRSGKRSGSALEALHEKGIRNVSHLKGGILAWPAAIKRS